MKPYERDLNAKEAALTNSYYLEGLWLNGAAWDKDEYSIDECEAAHLTSIKMPVIHIMVAAKGQKMKEPMQKETDSGRTIPPTSKKTGPVKTQVITQVSPRINALKIVFEVLAPVYVTSKRNRAMVEQKGDDQLILLIPLPTRFFKPAHWIKRNICITCYSDELD